MCLLKKSSLYFAKYAFYETWFEFSYDRKCDFEKRPSIISATITTLKNVDLPQKYETIIWYAM